MKHSIRTKLSVTILMIVLLTVGIISFLSNYFINRQFADYLARQQELKTQIITSSISQQYSSEEGKWNLDYIHAIGMFSLYEGYIIKVTDSQNNMLWDAQAHDMHLCNQIMDDISERMRIQYPRMDGEFTAITHQLEQKGIVIGNVSISYFGPFFLNENDFRFLHSLNVVLVTVGAISLAVSFLVGNMLAKRISNPILRTVEATKQIADGKYQVRLEEGSDTKELNLLVDSINHLALSLETLENLRKQLTEDVAHELRTPITILQSYLEAMTEGVWDASQDRLISCYEEVVRIGKLVGDLEKLARLDKNNLKLNLQQIDLYIMVDKTVSSFEQEIGQKKLRVVLSGPSVKLNADPDRMKQVVVNLLSNAIKYSKEDTEIIFQFFETKDVAGFYIRDKGIGISKEELPYIFERFYRADKSRTRTTGGSGIGLTIVKSIVEAHGGRVSVESVVNEGSIFTVTLPKGKPV